MASTYFLIFLLSLTGIAISFVALSAVRRVESMLKTFPLNELTFRIYQLEQKLAALQKQFSTPTPPASAFPPAEQPSPPPSTPVAAPPALSKVHETPPPPSAASLSHPPPPQTPRPIPTFPQPSPEPSSADLEALIGGRWFNRIGIIALLFAISYFLKLAFDNNWIGPSGRVAIGIILGLLMLPWSDWFLSRDYTYFSEGIAGLGEATLFVSVWAGCQYYTLFSRQVGFLALVLVTLLMAYLALRRNSERIAFLSLLGGLLTPALMSSGKNEQVVLFSYLLLLGAAALFVSWRKNWQTLLPLAFGGTHLYFWQWYDLFYTRAGFLGSTLLFATLIFLLFAGVPAARALLRLPLRAWDTLLVLANAFAYIAILYTLLWPNDRWPLTLLFLALAIAHEAIVLLLPDPRAEQATTPRFLYTGLAVACLTLAIPAKLEHNAITVALTVEGTVLVCTGFRTLSNLLRPFGYFLLFLASLHLMTQPPAAEIFLLNERFATYLLLITGLAVSLWSALSTFKNPSSRPQRGIPLGSPREAIPSTTSPENSPSLRAESSEREIPPRSIHEAPHSPTSQPDSAPTEIALLTIAINFFSLLALSFEFWDLFGGPRNIANSLAQHLSISILWTVYAALLLVLGMQRQWPLLRWQALVLLGVVAVKVFFYDLSFLDRVYRILSFLILGSALLAVSFFYQRKLSRTHPSL